VVGRPFLTLSTKGPSAGVLCAASKGRIRTNIWSFYLGVFPGFFTLPWQPFGVHRRPDSSRVSPPFYPLPPSFPISSLQLARANNPSRGPDPSSSFQFTGGCLPYKDFPPFLSFDPLPPPILILPAENTPPPPFESHSISLFPSV